MTTAGGECGGGAGAVDLDTEGLQRGEHRRGVVAVGQVVSGVVFVLDGVLIGAGDGRYLAAGMVVALAA